MPGDVNQNIKTEDDDDLVPARPAGEALTQLLPKIENFSTTIPDSVLVDLMSTAGFSTNQPAIVRLMSLAAQKWLSGITYDALQHCKVRTSNLSSKSHHSSSHGGHSHRQDTRTLTMEDLTPALAEEGIVVKKPPYYE